MLSQIACGDRPSSPFSLSSKSDPKSHAAVVAVITIDYQPPPLPVAADVVAVSIAVSRRCHIVYIGGGGRGHDFVVVLSHSSCRMNHRARERYLLRTMNLCWWHIETHRASVGTGYPAEERTRRRCNLTDKPSV